MFNKVSNTTTLVKMLGLGTSPGITRFFSSIPGMTTRRVRKVAVGMSAGVDSTVSALLLKQKGYDVVGVFMKNWDSVDELGYCQSDKDAEEAEDICKQMNIPFYAVNFVKEYWHEVFNYLISEYEDGFTPNPDIQCNKFLKFGHFHKFCMENIGCDAVATGHYARTSYGEDFEFKSSGNDFKRVKLLRAIDRIKDQTFFLSQVDQTPLQTTMFPVGNFTKDVVKKIALTSGFEKIAKKRESMGVCFVGKKKAFGKFLTGYVDPLPGQIINLDTGKLIGEHKGIQFYTIGQRVVNYGGHRQKLYVAEKDLKTRIVYACSGRDHPALYSETFFTGKPHWIDQTPEDLMDRKGGRLLKCEYRSQNTHPLTGCVVLHSMTASRPEHGASNYEYFDKESLTVSLVEPQRAITPGQYAVFYVGDECLGSARIERVGPSIYTMNKNNCRDTLKHNASISDDNLS